MSIKSIINSFFINATFLSPENSHIKTYFEFLYYYRDIFILHQTPHKKGEVSFNMGDQQGHLSIKGPTRVDVYRMWFKIKNIFIKVNVTVLCFFGKSRF